MSEFPALKLPNLEFLDISYNKLEKINEGWVGHEKLRIIKSVDNKFKNLNAFKNLPKLEELYLGNNSISNLNGWENLPSLRKLHLRKNKIEKVEEELPELPALEYLNLRSNKIANLETIERLFQFAELKDLNLLNNPVYTEATSFNIFMAEVLTKNVKLTRFCKTKVTEPELLEAVYLGKFKWEKSE